MQALKLNVYLTFKYNGLLTYVFVKALLLSQAVYTFFIIYPLCRCCG
jgi:hypothetical protein